MSDDNHKEYFPDTVATTKAGHASDRGMARFS